MKLKKTFSFIIFAFIFFGILVYNLDDIRSSLRKNLSHNTKIKIKKIFFGSEFVDEVFKLKTYNYNQKILPRTLFEKISFDKKLLENLNSFSDTHYAKVNNIKIKQKKFFLENLHNSNILYISHEGKISILDLEKFKTKEVNSNLDKFSIFSILDIELIRDKIYISFSYFDKNKNDCTYFSLAEARLVNNFLNFKTFFKTNKCLKNTLGGRIVDFNFKGKNGILITLGAADEEKDFAQDDNSFYGKTVFFDEKKKIPVIFSKGHRNPQGLVNIEGNILLTEHGPFGGDEINKISYGNNYGFPIVSLGETYEFDKEFDNLNKKFFFKKKHKANGFAEPIFSFIEGIGISEIIKIPNDFSDFWMDDFFVSSLNARSLYRVNFDNKYQKVNFIEKIYIGERIRDIIYIAEKNIFLLALEETGSIGILKNIKSK